jgi:hypothetical protein
MFAIGFMSGLYDDYGKTRPGSLASRSVRASLEVCFGSVKNPMQATVEVSGVIIQTFVKYPSVEMSVHILYEREYPRAQTAPHMWTLKGCLTRSNALAS